MGLAKLFHCQTDLTPVLNGRRFLVSTHISVHRRRVWLELADGRRLSVDHVVEVSHQVQVQARRCLHFCGEEIRAR